MTPARAIEVIEKRIASFADLRDYCAALELAVVALRRMEKP